MHVYTGMYFPKVYSAGFRSANLSFLPVIYFADIEKYGLIYSLTARFPKWSAYASF